jgi:hypothetical protein
MTLSRAERRRADREIAKLIKRDGDRCSICHAALIHNCKTYAGVTASGKAAITSECCASKLAFVLGAGFYADRARGAYDFLTPRESPGEVESAEKVAAAIRAYRAAIAFADKAGADIAKRGGIPQHPPVSLLDNPWKADDRAWFEKNPGRSHRLRPMFPAK